MRTPAYRRHSSGQARVTINGKDFLLGKFGSPESRQKYQRLLDEYKTSNYSPTFGKPVEEIRLNDVLLSFLNHAETYYQQSDERYQFVLTSRPLSDLYGELAVSKFGPIQFKALREWWLSGNRSRQYVNKQMARTLRIVRWAVGEGMIPPTVLTVLECIPSLQKGRCTAREAEPVTCVDNALVDATLPHLTQVLADMVRFQRLTGCRPGEVCKIKPSMVDRSGDVWAIELAEHKTAHRGKERLIFVGPLGQAVLAPYLLRSPDAYCFSPIESERQRRQARHEARVTPLSCGNKPGSKIARKPRKQPGEYYTTGSYAKAIRYACTRAKLEIWSPNQLRHNAATAIRKQFGLEAAQVALGHSGADVTQVYAEADRSKAIEVARKIG